MALILTAVRALKPAPSFLPSLLFLGGNYIIDDVLCVTPPWDNTEIFLVMKVEILAGERHHLFGKLLIFNRKFKLIRSDGAGSLALEAVLNEFTLVSLENNTLVNHIVERATLNPFAKNEIKAEVNKYS